MNEVWHRANDLSNLSNLAFFTWFWRSSRPCSSSRFCFNLRLANRSDLVSWFLILTKDLTDCLLWMSAKSKDDGRRVFWEFSLWYFGAGLITELRYWTSGVFMHVSMFVRLVLKKSELLLSNIVLKFGALCLGSKFLFTFFIVVCLGDETTSC